jgi:cytochrome b6-f complex iron-sulfur subunit
MQRRSFLKLLASLLGATAVGAFAYPLVRFLLPVESAARFKSLKVPESQVPLGGFKDLLIGGTPAIIVHTKEKGFVALSRVCTHLGCLVKYHPEKQEFICPCHAGTFDLDGNVISGPPPRPLPKYSVKVVGTNLVIGA